VKYLDRRVGQGDAAIITVETPGKRDLRASKRLRFMEPGVFGEDFEVYKIDVKYRVASDSAEYMLELSERPEKKYPQKHAMILERWLKAKGFALWMTAEE